MWSFLVRRLASAVLVIVGVVLLVSVLIHLVPGDPVEMMLGETAPAADRESLRRALGLDQPMLTQISKYFLQLVHLDLGESLHSQRAVVDLLAERIPATAQLAVAALLTAVLIAFPLGVVAAAYKDRMLDRFAMTLSTAGISIPNFWLGPILILFFSVQLGWFPVSGKSGLLSLILPAITLGTAMAAILARMIRASLLEVLTEQYVLTARAKGLSQFATLYSHAVPNALLPVLTLVGLQLGALLAGAVITETVFSWPGIGQLTVEAIHRRDYPVVQGCVLLISLTYVVVNTLTDIAYGIIDPRIRLD